MPKTSPIGTVIDKSLWTALATDPEAVAAFLRLVPDDLLRSEWNRRMSKMRKKKTGGIGTWKTHHPDKKYCRCVTCTANRKQQPAKRSLR